MPPRGGAPEQSENIKPNSSFGPSAQVVHSKVSKAPEDATTRFLRGLKMDQKADMDQAAFRIPE